MTPAIAPQPLLLPSKKGLLVRLAASLAAAAILLVCLVLPAEFHIDPTGLGKVTGLMALSQPVTPDKPASATLASQPPSASGVLARSYAVPFRSDEIKIPLKADQELEYKVKMQPGGTLVYSWAVNKGMVYYDFHGEKPEDPEHAQSYAMDTTTHANGSLIAPFAGIHGWFFQNEEGGPVMITLKMSGYYELREKQSE